MKHLYAMLALLLPVGLCAQTATVQNEKCLAHYEYERMMASDPAFRANQAQLEQETEAYVPQYIASHTSSVNRNASVVRIIPVVFHIIHEGGPENISVAQIHDQIDSLNKDYRRLNADAASTPAPFQALGADAEIEFRLATLDPQGNCTDGIERIFSPLTNNARDNVKALSYWPRNQYLNIWVVKTIENTSGASGIILGFAQFPGGTAATDGVEMRSDVVGSIGTAAFNSDGRTATHEIGHWLNLRHIWGDANCGSDFVTDTPTQQTSNNGCPAFPHVTCSNGPNGDMFTNYMDYTDGSCQDIFSLGQAARMNAALSSGTSNRNNLWSAANLIATGTDGTPGATCVPVAAFVNQNKIVCEGTTINFNDGSWNSPVVSWQWDFPGGTPSSSTQQNPAVLYSTAGVYDVTLTATNSAGSNSYTETGSVTVVPAIGVNAVPYAEGFETTPFPGTDWPVINESGNTWTLNTSVAHSGTNSVFIYNYTGNTTQTTDDILTPTFNLSNVTNANLTFWLAFAARSNTSVDQLKVFASTTCGQIWNIRYNKTGLALSTAGLVTTNFIPTAAQWRQETVNIASSSYNNKPNVRFKFNYFQGNGNNIYIDDINLNGTVGIDEVMKESLNLNVHPNPVSTGTAFIEFTLTDRRHVSVDVVDVLGRVVNSVADVLLDAGDYRFELPAGLASGMYNVRLNADGYVTAQKVLVGR